MIGMMIAGLLGIAVIIWGIAIAIKRGMFK